LAAQCFSLLANIGAKNAWMQNLLWIFAACMAVGGLFSFLVPETNGKTLEELGGDEPLPKEMELQHA
jgi:PHS family inorganic phosphate transporter-like MFS transporter